ncbi:MAG: hypothetical protein JNK82_33575 [Myxococcaceae bacterium]|nr:hypothetical protein [Myxococcaceae bacterium]
MIRAATLVALLLSSLALARPADCNARCDNDQKECQLKCAKGAGKHAAACRGACAQFIEPCRDECKKRERRK